MVNNDGNLKFLLKTCNYFTIRLFTFLMTLFSNDVLMQIKNHNSPTVINIQG